MSLQSPQPVPPTLGTALQKRIGKSLNTKIQLQMKQEMGIFQTSILEAFNKLPQQLKSLHNQIKTQSATISKPPSDSVVDQITESDPYRSTSHASDFDQRAQNYQWLRESIEEKFV